MRKVLKIFGLLWRLGRERGLLALYLFSAFCFISTCFMPKAYFRLQLTAFVVFLAVNVAFVLRAVMETLWEALRDTIEWLYYDAPLLSRLPGVVRFAWRHRETAMNAVYQWSYRLLLKTERFSQEHPTVENLILGAYGASVADLIWGILYVLTTNRYPPYGRVHSVCGHIFVAGIAAFLFFWFVALLNAALEWFYRLRAGGFFDALRLAASVFITVSRELVLNRLRSSGPEGRVHPEGPGAYVYEPHPLTLTVLPPLEKEPHQCR